MNPVEIQRQLRREPFEAFNICVSDGSVYSVEHPENAIVTRTTIAIAVQTEENELSDHLVYCDPLHITRIEPKNGDMGAS